MPYTIPAALVPSGTSLPPMVVEFDFTAPSTAAFEVAYMTQGLALFVADPGAGNPIAMDNGIYQKIYVTNGDAPGPAGGMYPLVFAGLNNSYTYTSNSTGTFAGGIAYHFKSFLLNHKVTTSLSVGGSVLTTYTITLSDSDITALNGRNKLGFFWRGGYFFAGDKVSVTNVTISKLF